jgi:predicted secreted protein
MKRAILLGLVLAAPAQAQTMLHLAETATINVHPDELVATLRVQAIAPTAAAAQGQVNAAMAAALERAKQAAGVSAATGFYSVFRQGLTPQDHSDKWQASQTLDLHSEDGAALLTVIGDLQTKGLAVNHLAWQLSPETERKARAQATAQALKALRGRADDAAALVDLQFAEFRDIRLDSVRPMPIAPRAMMTASSMASSAPPPSAEPEDVPVSATAEADILLKPR